MLKKIIKLFRILATKGLIRYLYKKVPPAIEHINTIRSLPEIATLVDIGANKGQFSALIRTMFPNAIIYAFEPLSQPANRFKSTFKDPNTHIYNFAIGPADKIEIIHVSKLDDSSSILPISELQVKNFPGTEEIRNEQVFQKRLISVLNQSDIHKPALLKIDVQGYEFQVLEGSKELLNYFDWIYVECSFVKLYKGQALAHEVIDFLHDHSFKLVGIYNLYYNKNGISIQGDFLFKNSVNK